MFFTAQMCRPIGMTVSREISGILDEAPTIPENPQGVDIIINNIVKGIVKNLNAVRVVALTCGILAAACVLVVLAVKYSITSNPINRNEVKKWTVSLIIGAVALGAVSAICAFLYTFGVNLSK